MVVPRDWALGGDDPRQLERACIELEQAASRQLDARGQRLWRSRLHEDAELPGVAHEPRHRRRPVHRALGDLQDPRVPNDARSFLHRELVAWPDVGPELRAEGHDANQACAPGWELGACIQHHPAIVGLRLAEPRVPVVPVRSVVGEPRLRPSTSFGGEQSKVGPSMAGILAILTPPAQAAAAFVEDPGQASSAAGSGAPLTAGSANPRPAARSAARLRAHATAPRGACCRRARHRRRFRTAAGRSSRRA